MSRIVCYHSVDSDWRSPLSIPVPAFHGQVAWVARNLAVLDLENAVSSMDRAGRLPRRTTCLTFDDGYVGVYREAYPALARHGLRATLFVVSGTLDGSLGPEEWMDRPDRGEHDVTVMGPGELHELAAAGWAFGSHSHSHRDLGQLSEEECERDLRRSREHLEDTLSRPIHWLAYPRGRHAEHVRRAARRAGFTHGFALPDEREPVTELSIPRVGIYRGDGVTALRAKLSRWYLPVRTSRAYPVLRRTVRAARAVAGRSG